MNAINRDDPARTADAGTQPWDPEPAPTAELHSIINTLAIRTGTDSQMRGRDHWILRLTDETDFLKDLNFTETCELFCLIARAKSTIYQHIHNKLVDTAEELNGEDS